MSASNQGTAMGSSYTPQSGHTGVENPPNPDETLQELRRNLDEVVIQLSNQTNVRDMLKSDITALEKIVSDSNQILNTYSKVLKSFEDAKKDLTNYFNNKNIMIVAAIKDKKDIVDSKIKEIDDKITKINGSIHDLQSKYDGSYKSWEQSKTIMEDKQRFYEGSKSYQKQIEHRLKDIQNLKEQIEANEKINNIGKMYFLIGEIKNALDGLNIKSQEDLRGDLHKSWKELNDAREDVKKKGDELAHLKAELEAKQQELELLRVNRVKNILANIGNM